MSNRVYRLLERHQKLDEMLRRAQSRRFADPHEIGRLKKLKLASIEALPVVQGKVTKLRMEGL